jgi:hypothetical protein
VLLRVAFVVCENCWAVDGDDANRKYIRYRYALADLITLLAVHVVVCSVCGDCCVSGCALADLITPVTVPVVVCSLSGDCCVGR